MYNVNIIISLFFLFLFVFFLTFCRRKWRRKERKAQQWVEKRCMFVATAMLCYAKYSTTTHTYMYGAHTCMNAIDQTYICSVGDCLHRTVNKNSSIIFISLFSLFFLYICICILAMQHSLTHSLHRSLAWVCMQVLWHALSIYSFCFLCVCVWRAHSLSGRTDSR